jgi:hypothetical protein
MDVLLILIGTLVVLAALTLTTSARVVQQIERGVVIPARPGPAGAQAAGLHHDHPGRRPDATGSTCRW